MSAHPLDGDLLLALNGIAAELNIDVDSLPIGITGILRALSVAHYQAGVTDTVVRLTRAREVGDSDHPPMLASQEDVTPAYGPYGGRRRDISAPPPARFSSRPTPVVPPPWDVDDSQDLH